MLYQDARGARQITSLESRIVLYVFVQKLKSFSIGSVYEPQPVCIRLMVWKLRKVPNISERNRDTEFFFKNVFQESLSICENTIIDVTN